jgi:hypothetical protein
VEKSSGWVGGNWVGAEGGKIRDWAQLKDFGFGYENGIGPKGNVMWME